MTAIPSLDQVDVETYFSSYFLQNRPCLVRSGASHWPALERWQHDDYLRRQAGRRQVARTRSLRDDLGFDHQSPITSTRLSDFLGRYRDDHRLYINDAKMPSVLVQDLGPSSILDGFARLEAHDRRVGMFMGGGEQFAPLHYDDEDNIYVVIAGEKQFTLYDIADFPKLYAHDNPYLPDFSQVADPAVVDAEAFPDFERARRYDVHLGPGDMLYVPGYWWHSVRSLGRTIALSYVRLDRRTQRTVFRKLLRAGVFPIRDEQVSALTALLDDLPRTARKVGAEVGAEVKRGRISTTDLLALYSDLVTQYCEALARADSLELVQGAFDGMRAAVTEQLMARVGEYSYPVLYLLQNFFRTRLPVFRDDSAEGDGT